MIRLATPAALALAALLAACSSTAPLVAHTPEPAPPVQAPITANAPAPSAPPTAAVPGPTAPTVPAAPHTSRAADTAQPPVAGAQPPLSALESQQAARQAVALLTPPTDLWDRIRRGFGMPNLESDLVRDREQWYASRPEYLQRMGDRGRRYLFHIVEELERRNMPLELALLPFIESAFNPQAVSSAKAAGMWQFMPATGRHFDLKQNAFRDDRRDVLASTRAALDYLQKLHGMFGDWHLALAAYNWGEGSVSRAIAKNRRAGLGVSYTELSMPAETRLYVPKFQAMKNIVATPQAFAASLPVVETHPSFQTVTITRDIDVAVAARMADVEPDDFRSLNPSAHRPVILAAGTPQILLPWDNAALFERNLQASGNQQLATWTAWQAPTTMKPADAAKRVGISEAELRQVNRIPNGMLIRAGSTLLVPRSAHVREDVPEKVADNGQLALSPMQVLARRTIRVGQKETLASLARRFKVSPDQIIEWNRMTANASQTIERPTSGKFDLNADHQ